jgi:hypothetical protein
VFGKGVRVKWVKKDQYGRVLGDVYAGDSWINHDLVREGFAWHYKHYDKRPELDKAEQEARKTKRGLWVDEKPQSPWDYRRPRRPPEAQAALFWLNTSSNVRHNQGCRHFNNTKRGRFCGQDEGKPCGICGG